MQNRALHTRGFSLVELIIYIGVFAVIFTVVGNSFYTFIRAEARAESSAFVDEALRFAGETITRDIERASLVITPTKTATSSALVLIRDGEQVVYTFVDGVLTRQIGTSTPESLTAQTVRFTTTSFSRVENYQAVPNASSTSIYWELSAKHRNEAPEFSFVGYKEGTAQLRTYMVW